LTAPSPAIKSRTTDRFYLIWTKNGRNPKRAHTNLESAQKESRRLAAAFPDRRFFILEAVERVWVNEAPDRQRPTGDEERDLNPEGWPQ
jgi:hypothetical protein